MGFVTVNSKSLVVIPKNVRDKYGIYPGDKLKVAYDAEKDAIVMKKIDDVKSLSDSIAGMWSDNSFKLEEVKESSDERIAKLLKNKLQQKRSP
jgi:AbrB family looped-hinge helix DNA binding protein